MSGRMTARQGWWRFPGHFLIWAAAPHLVAYPLFLAGVHNAYLTPVAPIALFVFILTVLTNEITSTTGGKQTVVKAVIDVIAKLTGFTLGLLTWQWWWY